MSGLVQELRDLKTDASTKLLVAAMDDPRAGTAQTYAAIELMRRGVDSALASIEREWEQMEQPRGAWGSRNDGSTIAGAFLEFAGVERIREFADGYARLSDARRNALVDALEHKWIFERTDATRHRIYDDILLEALDDHVRTSTAYFEGGVRELRRSDEAARALLREYDDTGIDRTPPPNMVDREPWLLAIRNAIRAKHGLQAVAAARDLPEGPLVVGDVVASAGVAGMPTPLRKALEERMDAPLDRENVGRLLDGIVAVLSEHGGSIRVIVSRHAGHLARMELSYVASGGDDGMWQLSRFAQVGRHTVQPAGSFGTTASAFPDESRADVLDMVDRALGHDRIETSPLYLEITISHR